MPRPKKATPTTPAGPKATDSYKHPEADLALRPEVGAQPRFKKHKPAQAYRYDSSLSPSMEWDGLNPAREAAEAHIARISELGLQIADLALKAQTPERDAEIKQLKAELKAAQSALRKISGPFLNWSGKAERLSFDVPTLPLFVHERLSTKAIVETLKGHRKDAAQTNFMDALLGGGEKHSLTDQLLRAYEHGPDAKRDKWVNRLMLGDSLVVMNSLLRYESLGGQVQMIYMDPPYGVKFGSNFQPFVRKRDVSHNDDEDMTREPEMVQAYRDTWELGLHSYLTYLRDRLLLARDLLHPSGSLFVQISDENVHHVREVMDEVFGEENFVSLITFAKTSSQTSVLLPSVSDYLLWFARDKEHLKYRQLYESKKRGGTGSGEYSWVELPDGTRRRLTREESDNPDDLPSGSRFFIPSDLTSARPAQGEDVREFQFNGRQFSPGKGTFKTDLKGLKELEKQNRLIIQGETLRYVRFFQDFPVSPIMNTWTDTAARGWFEDKLYVVQTAQRIIQRCMMMTTDPGDLVLDPTCGSGTTAYVAEQWGRRWITMDTSRVPLALARQRLLTATFDYHELKDEKRGPAGGFVYKRKQNRKGEEVGGIVPHITLGSIANNEPAAEEVLVDRPEKKSGIVRVTGPFTFEATLPVAHGIDDEPETPGIQGEEHLTHVERMIEVLRRAPVLRLAGNQTATLRNIRPPAKTLSLSAEALLEKPSLANLADDAAKQPELTRDADAVAILFGPENGPLSERMVREAWDEAERKHYKHLFVIGFAIEAKAREEIAKYGQVGMPATYLQATMDLQMGDLLKNMRSSQVFSVCGLPEVEVKPSEKDAAGDKAADHWQVSLLGLDTFDPITMTEDHYTGDDVPAWLLDTDYNGMCFHVSQAFFPRTGAWENLKKALKADYAEGVWDHLAGTVSAPFEAGEHRQVAVKVIDPRGNELLVVRKLETTGGKKR